jgi:RNA polymerase-binding transcription factor DksA
MSNPKPASSVNGNPSPASKPAASPKPHVPPQWAWHHRALLALRRRLGAETRQHQLASAAASVGDSTEPVDTVSDKLEHDLLLAELRLEENTLAEVDAALARIQSETYGICEATGKAIPAQRLRALPWTRVVREVAEQREHSSDHPPVRR